MLLDQTQPLSMSSTQQKANSFPLWQLQGSGTLSSCEHESKLSPSYARHVRREATLLSEIG